MSVNPLPSTIPPVHSNEHDENTSEKNVRAQNYKLRRNQTRARLSQYKPPGQWGTSSPKSAIMSFKRWGMSRRTLTKAQIDEIEPIHSALHPKIPSLGSSSKLKTRNFTSHKLGTSKIPGSTYFTVKQTLDKSGTILELENQGKALQVLISSLNDKISSFLDAESFLEEDLSSPLSKQVPGSSSPLNPSYQSLSQSQARSQLLNQRNSPGNRSPSRFLKIIPIPRRLSFSSSPTSPLYSRHQRSNSFSSGSDTGSFKSSKSPVHFSGDSLSVTSQSSSRRRKGRSLSFGHLEKPSKTDNSNDNSKISGEFDSFLKTLTKEMHIKDDEDVHSDTSHKTPSSIKIPDLPLEKSDPLETDESLPLSSCMQSSPRFSKISQTSTSPPLDNSTSSSKLSQSNKKIESPRIITPSRTTEISKTTLTNTNSLTPSTSPPPLVSIPYLPNKSSKTGSSPIIKKLRRIGSKGSLSLGGLFTSKKSIEDAKNLFALLHIAHSCGKSVTVMSPSQYKQFIVLVKAYIPHLQQIAVFLSKNNKLRRRPLANIKMLKRKPGLNHKHTIQEPTVERVDSMASVGLGFSTPGYNNAYDSPQNISRSSSKGLYIHSPINPAKLTNLSPTSSSTKHAVISTNMMMMSPQPIDHTANQNFAEASPNINSSFPKSPSPSHNIRTLCAKSLSHFRALVTTIEITTLLLFSARIVRLIEKIISFDRVEQSVARKSSKLQIHSSLSKHSKLKTKSPLSAVQPSSSHDTKNLQNKHNLTSPNTLLFPMANNQNKKPSPLTKPSTTLNEPSYVSPSALIYHQPPIPSSRHIRPSHTPPSSLLHRQVLNNVPTSKSPHHSDYIPMLKPASPASFQLTSKDTFQNNPLKYPESAALHYTDQSKSLNIPSRAFHSSLEPSSNKEHNGTNFSSLSLDLSPRKSSVKASLQPNFLINKRNSIDLIRGNNTLSKPFLENSSLTLGRERSQSLDERRPSTDELRPRSETRVSRFRRRFPFGKSRKSSESSLRSTTSSSTLNSNSSSKNRRKIPGFLTTRRRSFDSSGSDRDSPRRPNSSSASISLGFKHSPLPKLQIGNLSISPPPSVTKPSSKALGKLTPRFLRPSSATILPSNSTHARPLSARGSSKQKSNISISSLDNVENKSILSSQVSFDREPPKSISSTSSFAKSKHLVSKFALGMKKFSRFRASSISSNSSFDDFESPRNSAESSLQVGSLLSLSEQLPYAAPYSQDSLFQALAQSLTKNQTEFLQQSSLQSDLLDNDPYPKSESTLPPVDSPNEPDLLRQNTESSSQSTLSSTSMSPIDIQPGRTSPPSKTASDDSSVLDLYSNPKIDSASDWQKDIPKPHSTIVPLLSLDKVIPTLQAASTDESSSSSLLSKPKVGDKISQKTLKSTSKKKKKIVPVVCRICENPYPKHLMRDHTSYCVKLHTCILNAHNIESNAVAFKKYLSKASKRLQSLTILNYESVQAQPLPQDILKSYLSSFTLICQELLSIIKVMCDIQYEESDSLYLIDKLHVRLIKLHQDHPLALVSPPAIEKAKELQMSEPPFAKVNLPRALEKIGRTIFKIFCKSIPVSLFLKSIVMKEYFVLDNTYFRNDSTDPNILTPLICRRNENGELVVVDLGPRLPSTLDSNNSANRRRGHSDPNKPISKLADFVPSGKPILSSPLVSPKKPHRRDSVSSSLSTSSGNSMNSQGTLSSSPSPISSTNSSPSVQKLSSASAFQRNRSRTMTRHMSREIKFSSPRENETLSSFGTRTPNSEIIPPSALSLNLHNTSESSFRDSPTFHSPRLNSPRHAFSPQITPRRVSSSQDSSTPRSNKSISDSLSSSRPQTTGLGLSKLRVTIKDFEIVKPISQGAYGQVFLARKKITHDIYAIKVMFKQDVVQKNMCKQTLSEAFILSHIHTDHVVKLFYSFQTTNYLFLVMEFLPGGDLASLLKNVEILDSESVKFYAVEMLLALKALHENGIVHRDIKPDNFLIDSSGRLKLTDFGLSDHGIIDRQISEEEAEQATGFVEDGSPPVANSSAPAAPGTPDYLAPEVLLMQVSSTSKPYPLDFWSVGVCMYEMLFGLPPFHAPSPSEIFQRILARDIIWDGLEDYIEPELKDLIDKLLVLDPTQRIGAQGGVDEILAHPFFQDFPQNIASVDPPFVPETDSWKDTCYFDSREGHYPSFDTLFEDDEESSANEFGTIVDDDEGEMSDSKYTELEHNLDEFRTFSTFNVENLANRNQAIFDAASSDSSDSSEEEDEEGDDDETETDQDTDLDTL